MRNSFSDGSELYILSGNRDNLGRSAPVCEMPELLKVETIP
jgi:hypothetical protein